MGLQRRHGCIGAPSTHIAVRQRENDLHVDAAAVMQPHLARRGVVLQNFAALRRRGVHRQLCETSRACRAELDVDNRADPANRTKEQMTPRSIPEEPELGRRYLPFALAVYLARVSHLHSGQVKAQALR